MNATQEFVGRADFGVRLFIDYPEFETWCPECDGQSRSPVWLFLRDGVVIWQHGGLSNEAQFEEMVSDHLHNTVIFADQETKDKMS